MIERGEIASTATADNVTIELTGAAQQTAGPTGQQKATAALSAPNIGHLIALRPEP
jgi:hypothetical protein